MIMEIYGIFLEFHVPNYIRMYLHYSHKKILMNYGNDK